VVVHEGAREFRKEAACDGWTLTTTTGQRPQRDGPPESLEALRGDARAVALGAGETIQVSVRIHNAP
jgi:hypothetical protein